MTDRRVITALEHTTAALYPPGQEWRRGELRGEGPGHAFHGNQFGSSTGATAPAGGGRGGILDPASLPTGVPNTVSGIRADVRKTMKDADQLVVKSGTNTAFKIGGKLATGVESGTSIKVTQLKGGMDAHEVIIKNPKSSKETLAALKKRGYDLKDDVARHESQMTFYVGTGASNAWRTDELRA